MSSVQLTAADFHAARRFAETDFGRIAYVERGEGPAALFFHGFSLNGYQWRGALGLLSTQRRCIALDFKSESRRVIRINIGSSGILIVPCF